MENSTFVTDLELTDRVNEAVSELYDLIVSTYEHYYVSTVDFTLTGGPTGNSRSLAALTGGFYKDNTLERDPGKSNVARVPRLGSFIERHRATLSYFISGSNLIVYPPELAAGNYRLYYTPDPPVLANLDELDATMGRFYDYVQIRVAITILDKREMDSGPLRVRLADMRARVLAMAPQRTEEPSQVPLADRRWSGIFGDGLP